MRRRFGKGAGVIFDAAIFAKPDFSKGNCAVIDAVQIVHLHGKTPFTFVSP